MNHYGKILIGLMTAIFISSLAFAQDTTKVGDQNQVQEQNQGQNKENEQIEHGQNFVDEDGDGYNDNAPDHDGDGIPNGLDPDYHGRGKKYIDLNGDGIDDNLQSGGKKQQRKGIGPGKQKQSTGETTQQGPQKGQQKRGKK